MSHFLLTPFGSAGDVNPFLWLGRLLQARGHEVEVVTAAMFSDFVAKSGLAFSGVGETEELESILHHPDLWKPYRGTALVFEHSAKLLRPSFNAIAARMRGAETILVSPFHQFASRIAREKFGARLVTTHVQPACFLSVHDSPLIIPGTEWFNRLPHWMKRLAFSLPNPADSKLAPALRAFCRELGVGAPRRPLPDWLHSPDANLALFPEWFATPQPDWPARTVAAGFPLEDMKGQIEVPAELEAWIREGSEPVLLSPGSGNAQARDFFEAGIAACERLGLRALLGTRYPEQLPHPLPDHVRHFDYVPFSALLPSVCAFVHHGGIGSLSQGLAAGVPQLVMPMGHDQPDNAMRLKRLGAGDDLSPGRFTAGRVAEKLRVLTHDAVIHASCLRVAELCKEMNTAERAVAVLESVERH